MSLCEAMRKRGYAFRQHLEEEGWTLRAPTAVDLGEEQRAALEQGGVQGLREVLDRQGQWSFPALDIEVPSALQPDLVLVRGGQPATAVVAPGGDAQLWEMARELVDAIDARCAVKLPLIDAGEAKADLLETQHLVVVGGAHQNRLALELALRHQTFFVDASVPGEDGWVVTTHAGLHASGHNIAQIAAPTEHWRAALGCLLDGMAAEGDSLILRYTHRLQPGTVMEGHFPSWEKFTARLPGQLPQLQGQKVAAPEDLSALADLLAVGLDSGGVEKNFYNVAPIDIAITCARYYQLAGEPRALRLFRELLFRLADYYLKTPGGASYPADIDFRLGLLILHYARLEHESVFDDDDRLILANLLLACTRSVYEYTLKLWPIEPGAPTRHNHETFPALSLLYAADYFSRFDVPYVDEWRARADEVFSGGLWERFKQKENANGYEGFAFEHGAAYSAFTGRGLELFAEECLEGVVERMIATTDNFLRPVDYGDANVSMRPVDAVLARILATRKEGVVRWFAGEGCARRPVFLTNPVHDFPGLRLGCPDTPPLGGDWECVPLDASFGEEQAPGFPREFAFDKLALRTGWSDEDHYLLFEGVGNLDISHAHNEVNGIVRLNHLGRHWVVSNGYGRRVDLTNVAESFSSRVRGPEDHNMLVLQRDGEIVRDLPVCSALLQRGREGKLLYATGALLDYGGVNWCRTLVVLAGRYLLVIDRVQVFGAGLDKAHVEWNCLGEASALGSGFRLGQEGVFMDVASDSGWSAEQGVADQSASWKGVLGGGSYAYADFPLPKLIFQMPTVEAGQMCCLATLLAATRSAEPEYAIAQPEAGLVVVEGAHEEQQDLRIEDRDLAVRIDQGACEVRFAAFPEIPGGLASWTAS